MLSRERRSQNYAALYYGVISFWARSNGGGVIQDFADQTHRNNRKQNQIQNKIFACRGAFHIRLPSRSWLQFIGTWDLRNHTRFDCRKNLKPECTQLEPCDKIKMLQILESLVNIFIPAQSMNILPFLVTYVPRLNFSLCINMFFFFFFYMFSETDCYGTRKGSPLHMHHGLPIPNV